MTVDYTIEQFIEEFEEAQTPDAKQEVMLRLLDSDIDLVDNKELLIEYKAQIADLREQINIEEDIKINDLIDKGLMSLYTCTKSVNEFIEGNQYYVKVDDARAKYIEVFGEVPEALVDYINSIKPLIWIVTDNGIGTLKYKVLVKDFDFSQHFNKQ